MAAENIIRLICNNHLFEAMEILFNFMESKESQEEAKQGIRDASQRIIACALSDIKNCASSTDKTEIEKARLCKDWVDRFQWLIRQGLLVNRRGGAVFLLDIAIQHLSLDNKDERILGRFILKNHRSELTGFPDRFTRLNRRVKDKIFEEVWVMLV